MLQERLVLGDSLNFATTVAGFPASDGWALFYVLVPRESGTKQTISSSPDSTDATLHRLTVASSTTRDWTAGAYSWHAYVKRGAEEYTVGSGSVTLVPDPRQVAALDLRTDARQALEAVEALIKGKATTGQRSYRIGERTLESYELADLLKLRSELRADVAREQNAAALAAGQASRHRIAVRMGRA